ncbi:MAG TPA: hypothetical protein PKG48_08380 [Bacteroidales bacterium]|nr:hypothetical protein [Bacteroidales bacterium]HPS62286.1 hypothetical protein [Bacteroidales bacterium]
MKTKLLKLKFRSRAGFFGALMIFFLPAFTVRGQETVTITQQQILLSRGNQPAYVVTIPECDPAHAVKSWKNLIRQNTKSKATEEGTEIVIRGTWIREISDHPFSIYSLVIHRFPAMDLYAAFELDSNRFFSVKDTAENIQVEKIHSEIRQFLRKFGVAEYQYVVQKQTEKEKKQMELLKSRFDDMSDRMEKVNKNISSSEQNIRNIEDDIAVMTKENERKMAEIDSKKAAISAIKDPELLKEGKSQLRSAEKDKRSIEKELASARKKIVGNQSDIERYKRDIEDIVRRQEMKKTELRNQEERVDKLLRKLSDIK